MTSYPTRRELIEDAAFSDAEKLGKLPADRVETILSAIFFVLKNIAATNGVNPETIDRYANNVEMLRPHVWTEPTEEEKQAREDAETRAAFAPWLAKIKQQIAQKKGL